MSFGWSGMSGEGTMVPAVRHPLDHRSLGSSKNYEDSVRRRYEMEHEAAMRDSIERLMILQSQYIRKKLK